MVFEETVKPKKTETESVSESKCEWMGKRAAGCLFGRGFGVGEGQ